MWTWKLDLGEELLGWVETFKGKRPPRGGNKCQYGE